jgi:hypothetical protein
VLMTTTFALNQHPNQYAYRKGYMCIARNALVRRFG